ncbi:DUF1801 domain-containing protein [Brevundimonas sp.]|uniref:DUF1801 domain-containing protein n=1 Tax=Brevundimonas sp. TaxID=1871086 RepID=UPI002D3BEC8C|nr:DUF1801 domain-containing protein [Brevundimonas sp.]HYC74201.1 DUF1801 domain-containing protein [Brevundimonas sp.]
MAREQKTRPTPTTAAEFIATVEDPKRRADAEAACALLAEATGEPPVMWGPSIVGFGAYHYRYASGHEGDAPLVGFSPRKANLVFYLYCDEGREDLLARLGKHKSGKGCVYVNRLSDVDPAVLKEMAVVTAEQMRARYPG